MTETTLSQEQKIEAMMNTLQDRFDSEAAEGLDAVFQFDLEDGNNYYMTIKDGLLSINKGNHDSPSVTLIMDSETMLGIMQGDINGMEAFMQGRLRAEGEMMLAANLTDLFPN